MKTAILSIIGLLVLGSIVVFFSDNEPTGLGVRRLYLVGPNPDVAGKLCAKQISCKGSLIHTTAKPVSYDSSAKQVICQCPSGRKYRVSAVTYTYAGFEA